MKLYHVEVFIGPMDTHRDGCGGTFCWETPLDAAERARYVLVVNFPEVQFPAELGAIVTDGTKVLLRQPSLHGLVRTRGTGASS